MRVVGGWCRDKLLGLDPYDIDICLSSMTGKSFAEAVCKVDPSLSFGVVSKNAEKSKHLETVVINIDGETFDFAHLRTEIYESHSRIPRGTFNTDEFVF